MLKNDTADFFAFTSIFLQNTSSLCGNCLLRGVFLKKGTMLIGRRGDQGWDYKLSQLGRTWEPRIGLWFLPGSFFYLIQRKNNIIIIIENDFWSLNSWKIRIEVKLSFGELSIPLSHKKCKQDYDFSFSEVCFSNIQRKHWYLK